MIPILDEFWEPHFPDCANAPHFGDLEFKSVENKTYLFTEVNFFFRVCKLNYRLHQLICIFDITPFVSFRMAFKAEKFTSSSKVIQGVFFFFADYIKLYNT